MRLGATVDLRTLRLVRQVLVLFSRSFRPLEVANQFGDVIWLRESGLRVLGAEEPRNSTGQQVPRKREGGRMPHGSFSLASWSFHLSALPISAVEPECPRLWGV
jgi:hypothetical protein